MCISQHQHFDLISRSVLRVCAVLEKCFPVFSTEVSEGNSNSKTGKSQYIYLSS